MGKIKATPKQDIPVCSSQAAFVVHFPCIFFPSSLKPLQVMSGPAASPFRWKKCRLDFPGPGALQACKQLLGKSVSLHDFQPGRFRKGDESKDRDSPSLLLNSGICQVAEPGRQGLPGDGNRPVCASWLHICLDWSASSLSSNVIVCQLLASLEEALRGL